MTAVGIMVYAPGGLYKVAPPALYGSGAPLARLPGILGQEYFDTSVSPRVAYSFDGSGWVTVITSAGSFTTLVVTGQSTLGDTNIVGTTNINTSGAAVTTIGTGGTGAVQIGNATGNTAVTGTLISTGAITASTGNITATNGNIVRGTAGNKDVYTSVGATAAAGANSAGSVALIGGTIVVATTAVTASSLIRLTCQALGTVIVPSALCVSALTASTNFTILASDATDTSTIFWEIVN